MALLGLGCATGRDDDSGIYYPNPKATFKIAVGEDDSSPTSITAVHIAQLDTITLVDCDGTSHPLSFGLSLTSNDEGVLNLESPGLECMDQLILDASDTSELAALTLAVSRGEHSVRLKCYAAECFPLVFSGRFSLSAASNSETAPHELRWNVFPDPTVIPALNSSGEYDAGSCEADSVCERMETVVTQESQLDERPPGSPEWTTVMTL